VKINGKYMMFISEGCGQKQHIGFSEDMLHWEFEQRDYLDVSTYGKLYELACIIADARNDDDSLIMDFYYRDEDGQNAAGQALFNKEDPYRQLSMNQGGTLAWGGMLQYKGKWLFAQGWDAVNDANEIYFYSAAIK